MVLVSLLTAHDRVCDTATPTRVAKCPAALPLVYIAISELTGPMLTLFDPARGALGPTASLRMFLGYLDVDGPISHQSHCHMLYTSIFYLKPNMGQSKRSIW